MRSLCLFSAGAFALCMALGSGSSDANTLTAQVADYNAAQVALADGALTVPAKLATYSVDTGTLANGSTFIVTLPTNFTFASAPSLTNTGTSTFVLTHGGMGSQSATFTIGTADLPSGQSLSLDTFKIAGATALETLIPVSGALPLSMQSVGNDAAPLTVGAFASEPGITSIMVGAIQVIDTSPPSLGRLYLTGAPNDSATAVINAVEVEVQTVDAATQTVPVLSPNGGPNALAKGDTASVTLSGLWGGIATAFPSTTSDCNSRYATGTVDATSFTIPFVPIGVEEFGCVTADGTTPLQYNFAGFVPVTVSPGISTDFLGVQPLVEFPGIIVDSGTPPLPPTISKAFAGATVQNNGTTKLTFTVNNPNPPPGSQGFFFGPTSPDPLTGVGFTDTLPAGMIVATPNDLANYCGGTVTADSGTGSVSLAGATLPYGTVSCSFSVNVVVSGVGTIVNTTGPVTSTEGGTGGTASASITVMAPPTISEVFNPAVILANTTTSATFTLTNPSGNTAAETGVAFTDPLPPGLIVADASISVCGGTVTTSLNTIVLSSARIEVNSQCQFSVPVTATKAGQYANITNSVTSINGGIGNEASALLNVGLANLAVSIDDSTGCARNGQALNYLVKISNAGAIDSGGMGVTETLSADFDAAHTQWMCIAGTPGAKCTASGTGPLSDSSVSIPASGSLSWLVSTSILANALNATADNTINVTAPNDPDAPYHITDSDALVIFCGGFDFGDADGAESLAEPGVGQHAPILSAVEQPLAVGQTLALTIPGTRGNSPVDTLVRARAADGSGFRVERLNLGNLPYVRLISIDVIGIEQPGKWLQSDVSSPIAVSLFDGVGTIAVLQTPSAESAIGLSAQTQEVYRIRAVSNATSVH